MRGASLIAALLLAGPAGAQVSYPTPAPVDMSGLATTSQLNAVDAKIPTPANTAPSSEALSATAGAMTARYALEDHVHPRITRAATTTTDASGNWSVTWSTALAATPVVLPIPVNAGSQPVICNVTTRTTTTAAGKCSTGQTTVLSLSIVTSGLTVNAFSNTASGVTIQVLAIPTTQ